MSLDTVFIDAATVGLVKWTEFKKPPYTSQEYTDAYNNGVRMVQAVKNANDAGASKVILERGNYPFCYSMSSNGATDLTSHATIDGTVGLEFDGNSSCLFVIFDSYNKHQYNTSTTLPAYALPGSIFRLKNNTALNIYGFNLRGDNYNRTWAVGEKETEQTYGIYLAENNINTSIDVVAHGFRGDGVSGATRGKNTIAQLDTWYKGGLGNTGGLQTEVGAYRTELLPLAGKTILRNSLQIMTSGYLRSIGFRKETVAVYMYDSDQKFLFKDFAKQTEFIHLAKDTAFIRIVAYNDERTTDTVSYGTPILLVSGSSSGCEVRGEYYANNRGGISNLCNDTYIDAYVHDNSSTKYGFVPYSSGTKYCINFEDTYVSKLTVRGRLENCLHGVLCYASKLDVRANIKNMSVSGVSVYGTLDALVTESTFDNVATPFGFTKPSHGQGLRVARFVKNTIKGGTRLRLDVSNDDTNFMTVSDNTIQEGTLYAIGNGKNLVVNDNHILKARGLYNECLYISGALTANNNTAIQDSTVTGWAEICVNGRTAHGNIIDVYSAGQYLISPPKMGVVNRLMGTEINLANTYSTINPVNLATRPDWVGDFVAEISGCKFTNGAINFSTPVSVAAIAPFKFTFTDCEFNLASSALTVVILETASTANHTFTFKNCTFDVSDVAKLLDVRYAISGSLDILFLGCTFTSKTYKRMPIVRLPNPRNNITARAIGCTFINVKHGFT